VGYFAGLEVSLEETAICIVDDAGRLVREVRAVSDRRRWSRSSGYAGCGWSGWALKLARCRLGFMQG
jgi:hypothetical protein